MGVRCLYAYCHLLGGEHVCTRPTYLVSTSVRASCRLSDVPSRRTNKEDTMRTEHHHQSGGISRRQFLGALGLGAVALGTSSVLPGQAQQRFVLSADRFGRLFPQLPAFFDQATESLRGAMREMGQEGGLMDAKDALDQGPILLITNPGLSLDNPNNPNDTAGTTFMGQFMDHDMTFDLTSRLGLP